MLSEQNMDYAGKEFYGSHKYFNSVLVRFQKVAVTSASVFV